MEVVNKESNEAEEEVKLMYNPYELSNVNNSITNQNHNSDWNHSYRKHNNKSNNTKQSNNRSNNNENYLRNREEQEEEYEEEEEREENLSNTIAMSIRLNVNEGDVLDEREEENKLCTPAGQLLHTSHTPFAITPPCALPVKKYETHNMPFSTSSTVLTYNNHNNNNKNKNRDDDIGKNSTLQVTYANIDQESGTDCSINNYHDNILNNNSSELVSHELKANESESREKYAIHNVDSHIDKELYEKRTSEELRQPHEQVVNLRNINETSNKMCLSSKELSTLSPLSFRHKPTTKENTLGNNYEANENKHDDDVSIIMRYNPLTGSTITPEKVEQLDVEANAWLTNNKMKKAQHIEYSVEECEEEQETTSSLQEKMLLQRQTSQKEKTKQIFVNSNKTVAKHNNGNQLCKWDECPNSCVDNDNNSVVTNLTMANKKQKNEKMPMFTVPQTPIKKPRTMHNSHRSKILPTSLLAESNASTSSFPSSSSTLLTSSQLWANKINSTFASGKLGASLPFHKTTPLIANSARNKSADELAVQSELPLTSARETSLDKLAHREGHFAPAHFTPNNFVSTSRCAFRKNNTNGNTITTTKLDNNHNNAIFKGAPTVSRKRPSISISSQLDTMHLWESQTSQGINNSQRCNNNNYINNKESEEEYNIVNNASNQECLPSLQDTRRSIFTSETASSQIHKPLCTPDDSKANYFEHIVEQQQRQEREKLYKQQINAHDNVPQESCSHPRQMNSRANEQCNKTSNECNGPSTKTPAFFTPRILRDYNEVKVLGSGAFGSVGLYEEIETGKLVAIKYSSALTSDYIRKQWIREKVIMQHLRNFPHTLQLLSSWEELECNEMEFHYPSPHTVNYHHRYSGYGNENEITQEENSVSQTLHGYARSAPIMYLVLEYCPQGSVAAQAEIKRQSNTYWSESDLLLFLSHSAIALHALHSHNVAHVDFKPDNVLINDEGEYKLSDFGCSVLLDENEQPRTHLIVKKKKKKKCELEQQQSQEQKQRINCNNNNNHKKNKSETSSQTLTLTTLNNRNEEHTIKWEPKTQNGEDDDDEEEIESEQIELNVNSPLRFNWNNYCTSPSSQSSTTPLHTFCYTSTSPSHQLPPPTLSFTSQKVWSSPEEQEEEEQKSLEYQRQPLAAAAPSSSLQETRKECNEAHNGVFTCNEQLSLTFEYNNNTQMSLASVDEGDCRYLCSDMLNKKEYFKAGDIFSLGMSMYELMCNEPLPCNGEHFLNLRRELPVEHLRKSGRYSERLLSLVVQMTLDNPCHRPTAEQVLTFLQPPPATLSSFLESCPLGMHQSCAFVNVPTIMENNNNDVKTINTINANDNIKDFGDDNYQYANGNLCNNDTNSSRCLKKETQQPPSSSSSTEEYQQTLVLLKASLDASSYLVTHTLRAMNTTTTTSNSCLNNGNKNYSYNRPFVANDKENSTLEKIQSNELSVNKLECCRDTNKCINIDNNNNNKMTSAKHLSYMDGNEQVEQKTCPIRDLRVELLPTTQQASPFISRVCTPMTITNNNA